MAHCDEKCGCRKHEPIGNPPAREHDRIEVGLRAAMAIKCENAGLYRQRTAFLRDGNSWQPPTKRQGWRIHTSGGMASYMSWAPFEWSADA